MHSEKRECVRQICKIFWFKLNNDILRESRSKPHKFFEFTEAYRKTWNHNKIIKIDNEELKIVLFIKNPALNERFEQ